MGMNGPVTLEVTFSKDAITDIQVKSSKETGHVGDPAFPIMFKDAIEANGSGIDAVSGATFTSIAVNRHQHTGNNFIAVRNHNEGIKLMSLCHTFN